jgi:hypothetical protein
MNTASCFAKCTRVSVTQKRGEGISPPNTWIVVTLVAAAETSGGVGGGSVSVVTPQRLFPRCLLGGSPCPQASETLLPPSPTMALLSCGSTAVTRRVRLTSGPHKFPGPTYCCGLRTDLPLSRYPHGPTCQPHGRAVPRYIGARFLPAPSKFPFWPPRRWRRRRAPAATSMSR